MTPELTEKLIQLVQNLSPVVWSILMKQVIAESVSRIIIWTLFYILYVAVLIFFISHSKKMSLENNRDFVILVITCVVSFVMTIMAFPGVEILRQAILALYNPDFYAIKLLLGPTLMP